MGKEIAKKAGVAGVEAGIRAVMPWWDEALKTVRDEVRTLRDDLLRELRATREEFHTEIRTLDAKVDNLRQELVDKAEQHRELVNEVSHRVTRLDGKLEGYTEAMGIHLRLADQSKTSRKRRAV